ncbi:hypothetical protein [Desulfocurvibacter africanus]|uniref:hypothetical protein n=1 Tax=Desulfocurvibacter africanus TaxID=873 RepID=UPI0004102657|nr:hypothetical protein [Desulfocurvibacter africanus]
MSADEARKQWHSMLRHMLEEFRASNPNDPWTDIELLLSIMERLAEEGLVKKQNGKFVATELMPNA